jgi:hypothetical protein
LAKGEFRDCASSYYIICIASPCSGKLGWQFNRDMKSDPEQSDKYSKLVGHQEKARFRRAWASQKLQKIVKTTRKEQSSLHMEQVQGTYVPFKVLWDREGGDMAGYKAPIYVHNLYMHIQGCLMYKHV